MRSWVQIDAPTVQVPPFNGQELVASSSTAKDACSMEDETPIAHTLGGDINEKDAPISSPN